MIGAHIHAADIRNPYSESYPDLNLGLILTPSVSPIYYNNPGYQIMDISDSNSISTFEWRFFQLYEYTITHVKSFITADP
jgi:hypothetical protein